MYLSSLVQITDGGEAKTLMFVHINPDVESFFETMSSLIFAEKVSGVKLGAARSTKEGIGVPEIKEQVQFFSRSKCDLIVNFHPFGELTLKLYV